MNLNRGNRCICKHYDSLHEHHRRGTDCALCECGVYHRDTWLNRRLYRRQIQELFGSKM